MTTSNLTILLFACFAIALPLWGMQTNEDRGGNNHTCKDQCYQEWQTKTGGILAVAAAQAQAKADASPAELGKQAFVGCIACHGAGGEGGIGPALAGQPASDIEAMLAQYKNGETRGKQSALMWSQAAQLSDSDMANIAAHIETL